MHTILIPTDFRLQALDCISSLCEQNEGKELHLVFMHMFKLSDSIGDLLMLSRRNKEFEHVSDEFYQKCEELKASYPQIKSLKIDFFYGSTLSMFRNYIEGHDINQVLDPENCSISNLNKSSIDPVMLIRKCGLSILRLNPAKVLDTAHSDNFQRREVLEDMLKEV